MNRRLLTLIGVATLLANAGCAGRVTTRGAIVPSGLFTITKVSGSEFLGETWTRNDIYVRLATNDSQYVGSVSGNGPALGTGALADTTNGASPIELAISQDGRTVVFRHWTLHAPEHSKLEAGIYQYVYGAGIRRLYAQDEVGGTPYRRWDRVATPPRAFPAGILPFAFRDSHESAGLTWAVKTTGEKFPLALLDASPLHSAAFDGRTDDCAVLVKAGADINARTHWGFTPLELAIIRDHQETALQLLQLGASPDSGVKAAFYRAVLLHRMKVVEAMIEHGANVNAIDARTGDTPLHAAASYRPSLPMTTLFAGLARTIREQDRTSLIQLLLDHGADANVRNKAGNTPLDLVTATTPTAAVRLLTEHTVGGGVRAATDRAPFPCDSVLETVTSDVHPDLKWAVPRRGKSGNAYVACIVSEAHDGATIEAQAFLSSGLYKLVRECRETKTFEGGNQLNVIYRTLEYKHKGRPLALRLRPNQFVDPVNYIVVSSTLRQRGTYQSSIEQKSQNPAKITLCPPP